MKIPETENRLVKYSLLLGLGYLTVCSCLWQFSYWSSFNINIFPLLDLPTVLLSFAKQLALLFGIGILLTMMGGFQGLLGTGNAGLMEINNAPSDHKTLSKRISNIIFFTCLTACYLMYRAVHLWDWFWVVMPVFFSLAVSFRISISKEIDAILPDKLIRLSLTFVLFVLPAFFFASAKYEALMIYNDNLKINRAKIVICQSNLGDGSLAEPLEYKMIGETKDFVFVMTPDNRNILQIPFDKINLIEYDATPDTAHFKRHSRPEHIIRRNSNN